MSAVSHLSIIVEIMLFRRNFVVVTVAVRVLRTPEYSSKFPPTFSLVRCVSTLSGLMSHTIFPYMHFLVVNGTSCFGMKNIVLVPFIVLIPWSSCPNSLATDLFQLTFLSPVMRCLYY